MIRSLDRSRRSIPIVGLLLVLAVAAWLRLVGLDWDEGTHLHPDERFLTMVETAIQPTFDIREYLTTATSPLNPRNRGHTFFVYGTLPIVAVRYVAEGLRGVCSGVSGCTLHPTSYDGVHLVGRALSALADLSTVVVLYLIGRRLYDRRVGLLAAALFGAAVLPIQQSHFFTVDTFLTFFVTLGFYFGVRVSQGGGRSDWLWFGASLGMALACKVSVWPLGIVLATAVLVRTGRWPEEPPTRLFLGLGAAAAVAFLTFRICQPDAFAGLGFDPEHIGQERFDAYTALAPAWWHRAYQALPEPLRSVLLPSPRWLANMDTIRNQMTGDVDFPPNHQWTNRQPVVFPWKNMVLYGMGPFLGLAAWAGWAVALVSMFGRRKAWQRQLLPVLWSAVFFLYQGTQWVKSMRYLLPVYPTLILLAAWVLVAAGDRIRASLESRRRLAIFARGLAGSIRWRLVGSGLGLLPVVLALLGTYAWAFCFVDIYRQPTTRVAAARWIYENVPPGATLLYQASGDGQPAVSELQVHMPKTVYPDQGAHNITPFTMPEDGVVTAIRMNHLSDPALDSEAEVFRGSLSGDPEGRQSLASATLAGDLTATENVWGDAHLIPLQPTLLAGGQRYYLVTEALAGAPMRSTGAVLVNESSWDDGLPLRLDGLDGFSIYEGEPLELYWEDDASKLERMIRLLDEADYLLISSSRQLGSITRLPVRYPLTIAYYQALFAGRLGYDLETTFTADLHIGPLMIDDVFARLGWRTRPEVGWPPPGEWAAEEAFSVYDHPPVWVFKKRADYSPAAVRDILEGVDITQRRFVIPYDYTRELNAARRPAWLSRLLGETAVPATKAEPPESRSMWIPAAELTDQRQGGTWADLFKADGVLTRHAWLGAAVWWVVVVLGGWLAFPLASIALRGLPSRGYVVSKALFLLLTAWSTWMLVSVRLTTYTRGAIWIGIGLLAGVSAAALAWRWRELVGLIRSRWRWIVAVEALGLALYVISLLIRSGNPDLWHPVFGGEKPLDFSFLNATLKSTHFPPYDPWLAGASLNYYYFGYVMVGNLIKLLEIAPYLAYNLALPMLFSLTGLGAFSMAFDLVAGEHERRIAPGTPSPGVTRQARIGWPRSAMIAGLAAACMVVLLGNLGQVATFVRGWQRLGAATAGPGANVLLQTGRGIWENLTGKTLPIYTGSWYWDATRIIPPAEMEAGPIAEFPFFTYLYADLHAHMIDMPLFLLALAWALALAQSADRGEGWPGWRSAAQAAPPWAVTWLLGGIAIGALRATNTWDWPTMLGVGCVAVAYAAARCFRSGRARLAAAVLGLAALVGLSAAAFLPFTRNFVPSYTEVARWTGGITPVWAYFAVHGLFLLILVTLLGREYRQWTRHLADESLRALEPWAWIIGLGVLAFLASMVATLKLGVPVGPLVILAMVPVGLLALQNRLPAERRAVLMLFTLGLALTLAVELVVFTGDVSRMNTVFKFYTQVWLIFSSIGGAALVWSWESVRRWRAGWRRAWLAVLGILVFLAALYPPTAVRAKIADRFHADQPYAGLDGMVYMVTATYYDRNQPLPLKYDYQAIRWLQENVSGSPVIMEANTYPKLYGWGNRFSIYTGLPAVVGWEWHTRQHRAGFPGATEEIRRRVQDVIAFYNTPDVRQAANILAEYDVEYVVVGSLERAYYSPVGLTKFDLMVEMDTVQEVYRNPGTVVYRVQ